MGAETFFAYGEGKTLNEAFRYAHDEATWKYGHRGYTGTLAEKPGATLTPDAPAFTSVAEALRWAQPDLENRDNDKWEPAWAVRVTDENAEVIGYLFYGWASS